jgi:signal transduction histidine kinase
LLEIGAPDAQHPAVAQLAFLEGPPLRMAEQEIRDRDAVRELMFGSTSGLALLFFTAMPLLTLIAAGPSVRRLEERASERARVDLLQRFSHELRTPAAAVQSLVGTLKSGAVEDPADQQQFLELALEEAGRLSRGLTRLMLAARGEGQLEVSPQAVDLVPWAHGVARRWAPRIDPLELHLPQRCIAMADLSRLDEAVEVLLDNATKYGKAPVFLSVTPTRSGVELAVEDAGPGVDEADRRHIFDKLVRGNQRQGEGFGLGLWIVREVARAHRGSVELRGNNRFVITLPAAAEG